MKKLILNWIRFSSSDDECFNDGDEDYDDLVDGDHHGQSLLPVQHVTPDISRRKKMPTPTPSLEDSVYSSLSNDMYSKIGSPTTKPTTKLSDDEMDEKKKENRDELRFELDN